MGLVAGPKSLFNGTFPTGGAVSTLVVRNTLGAKCIVVRLMGGNSGVTTVSVTAFGTFGGLPATGQSFQLVCLGAANPAGASIINGTGPVNSDGFVFVIVNDPAIYAGVEIPFPNVLIFTNASAGSLTGNIEAWPLYEKTNPSIGTGGKIGAFNEI